MAGLPVLSPGATTNLDRNTWLDTIEQPTFQATEFINTIREFSGKILNQGNVRKYGRALGTILAQGADGNGLTGTDFTAAGVTIDPVGRYIKGEWSANMKAQVDVDLNDGGMQVFEAGMAETLDTAGLAAVTSLTQSISQAAIDGPMWGQATGRLMQNTNGQYGPGDSDMIRAIFSPTQYPNIRQIPEFNNADVRGDSENPNVKGMFAKGGGWNVRFSTAITQDGNGWHNPLYVKDAFIIGWNQRTNGFEEQTELLFRIVVFANMGVSVLHDLRAIDLRTTASAL